MKKSELKKLIKKILKEDIDPRMTGYGMRDFRKSGETSDPFKLYNPSGEDVQSMKGLSKFLKNALEIIEDSNFDFKSIVVLDCSISIYLSINDSIEFILSSTYIVDPHGSKTCNIFKLQ